MTAEETVIVPQDDHAFYKLYYGRAESQALRSRDRNCYDISDAATLFKRAQEILIVRINT